MKVTTDVELEPMDLANFLKEKNSHVQLVFLYEMARLYWNYPNEFKRQLQEIQYELVTEWSHDSRNIIKYMVDDLSDYLGSEALNDSTRISETRN